VSAALPSELRARFREYLEEGLSQRGVAAPMRLSAATVVCRLPNWYETGSVKPGTQGRPLAKAGLQLIGCFWKNWS